MWKSMVEPERPQMTKLRMRFVCWINKVTYIHTHTDSEYVLLLIFHSSNGYANAPHRY